MTKKKKLQDTAEFHRWLAETKPDEPDYAGGEGVRAIKDRQAYFRVIPGSVWDDDRLSWMEKGLYGLISGLTNRLGYCFATNPVLAQIHKVHEKTVSRSVSKMINLGHLRCLLVLENEEVKQRRLYVADKANSDPMLVRLFEENPDGTVRVTVAGMKKKAKEFAQDNDLIDEKTDITPPSNNPVTTPVEISAGVVTTRWGGNFYESAQFANFSGNSDEKQTFNTMLKNQQGYKQSCGGGSNRDVTGIYIIPAAAQAPWTPRNPSRGEVLLPPLPGGDDNPRPEKNQARVESEEVCKAGEKVLTEPVSILNETDDVVTEQKSDLAKQQNERSAPEPDLFAEVFEDDVHHITDQNNETGFSNEGTGAQAKSPGAAGGAAEAQSGKKVGVRLLIANGISEDIARDFVLHRNEIKAPLTNTAYKTLVREAQAAGLTVEQVMVMCMENGWRGFRAAWMKERHIEVPVLTDQFGNEILTPEQAAMRQTEEAYVKAYRERYGIEPLRNNRFEKHLREFVKTVGFDEAPKIAEFYLRHNNSIFVQNRHDFSQLLFKVQMVRTDFLKGHQMTAMEARQTEGSLVNYQAGISTREQTEASFVRWLLRENPEWTEEQAIAEMRRQQAESEARKKAETEQQARQTERMVG